MEQNNDNHQAVTDNAAYTYLTSFPPGYRFTPRDYDLIVHYLRAKMNGHNLPINMMHEVNIYKYNPAQLAEKYVPQGDEMWYFFTPRDKKYKNGQRPNRRAGDGYWKATGADKPIPDEKDVSNINDKEKIPIGFRKALVFYHGKPPKGLKTPWIMHEFRVNGPSQATGTNADEDEDTSMRLDDYVLCRIYEKEEGLVRNRRSLQQIDHQADGGQDDAEEPQGEMDASSSANSVIPSKANGFYHEYENYINNCNNADRIHYGNTSIYNGVGPATVFKQEEQCHYTDMTRGNSQYSNGNPATSRATTFGTRNSSTPLYGHNDHPYGSLKDNRSDFYSYYLGTDGHMESNERNSICSLVETKCKVASTPQEMTSMRIPLDDDSVAEKYNYLGAAEADSSSQFGDLKDFSEDFLEDEDFFK